MREPRAPHYAKYVSDSPTTPTTCGTGLHASTSTPAPQDMESSQSSRPWWVTPGWTGTRPSVVTGSRARPALGDGPDWQGPCNKTVASELFRCPQTNPGRSRQQFWTIVSRTPRFRGWTPAPLDLEQALLRTDGDRGWRRSSRRCGRAAGLPNQREDWERPTGPGRDPASTLGGDSDCLLSLRAHPRRRTGDRCLCGWSPAATRRWSTTSMPTIAGRGRPVTRPRRARPARRDVASIDSLIPPSRGARPWRSRSRTCSTRVTPKLKPPRSRPALPAHDHRDPGWQPAGRQMIRAKSRPALPVGRPSASPAPRSRCGGPFTSC